MITEKQDYIPQRKASSLNGDNCWSLRRNQRQCWRRQRLLLRVGGGVIDITIRTFIGRLEYRKILKQSNEDFLFF